MFKKPYILVGITLFPLAVSTLFLDWNLSRILRREQVFWEDQIRESQVSEIVDTLRMPEMTGLQLLREVKGKHPQIVRVVLSGYTHITTLLTAINQGEIFRYITKPWENNDELVSVVMEALEHFERTASTLAVAASAPPATETGA